MRRGSQNNSCPKGNKHKSEKSLKGEKKKDKKSRESENPKNQNKSSNITGKNKEELQKGPQQKPPQKSSSNQQSIKCFTITKNKDKCEITSPEYKMAEKKKTRSQSKKDEVPEGTPQPEYNSEEESQQKDDTQGQDQKELDEVSDSDTSSNPTTVHSGLSPCPEPVSQDLFASLSHTNQMGTILSVINKLCVKVTEIDVSLNHDTDGINTQLDTLTALSEQNCNNIDSYKNNCDNAKSDLLDKISTADETITSLQNENAILKGIITKHSCQLKSLNEKVAMLTSRSMEKNLTISGLLGENKKSKEKEDCKSNVINFLKEMVEIDVDSSEIYIAHRVGNIKDQRNNKPRLMLIKCKSALKQRILRNAKNLKDKQNEQGDYFYINKQLPDQIAEQNREVREQVKAQKVKDSSLPASDRSQILIKNNTVYVDGQPIEKQLKEIEVNDLFPDKIESGKQEKLKLSSSDAITQEGSTFTAFALKTGQIHEVRRAYRKLYRENPSATHVIGAYHLKNHKGHQDDSEYGAGSRLLKMIEKQYTVNTAVFVVRIYGGRHLGPKRFNIIQDVAKEALTRAGAEQKKPHDINQE